MKIGKTLLCTAAAAFLGVALSPAVLSARAEVSPALCEVNGVSYRYFDEALSAWGQGTTMKLLENCTLSDLKSSSSEALGLDHLTVTESKTLDLNGKTLTGAQTGSVIYVAGEGVAFTLTDTSSSKSGKITGGSSVFGGGINLSGATLNFQGGAIADNTGVSGGGIYANEGTVNLNGGAVTGNKADFGGGIYLLGSTLNMSGSSSLVEGNEAAIMGGGIYAYGKGDLSSSLLLSGGKLSGNTAVIGGGATLWRGVAMELSGSAEIVGNHAQGGAGVYLFGDEENVGTRDSRFTMTGGKIVSNVGGNSLGGGVKVGKGGSFQMTAGTVGENTSQQGGGGVSIDSGAEAVFGGTAVVKQNTAKGKTDNVRFYGGCLLSLQDDFKGEIGFNCSSYGVIGKGYKGSASGITADDEGYEILVENGDLSIGILEATGIFIEKMPEKLDYALSDTPDLTGMVVKVTYKDGRTAEIKNYTIDSSPFTRSNTVREITYTVNGKELKTNLSFRVEGVSAAESGEVFEGGFIAVVVLSGLFLIALVFVGFYTDGFKGRRKKKEAKAENGK